MKTKFAFIFFVFFIVQLNDLAAQKIHKIKLYGFVKENSTNLPLEGANVFLNNTTLGAATDKYGYYYIKNIPPGNYELVVSMMGYQMIKMQIKLFEPAEKKINFKLKTKVLNLEQVEVVAIRPKNWGKNLEKFKKFFIGTSENASKCKIINPEVLDFEVNKFTGDFTANASDWLKFENQALGYQIIFYIIEFMANENGKMRYLLETQFIELTPENEEMQQSWQKNRLRAYKGSIRHFLRSLVAGRLDVEGFKMYQTDYPYWNDIDNTHLLRPDPEDMIDTLSTFERNISFDEYLKIVYTKEFEEKNFYDYRQYFGSDVRKVLKQTSWINLPLGNITVNTSGHRVGGLYNFEIFGYWAWEKFAELLPLDYEPPEEPQKLDL